MPVTLQTNVPFQPTRPAPALGMAKLAKAANPQQGSGVNTPDSVSLSPKALQALQAQTKVDKALQDPQVANKLSAFPPDFQKTIRTLSDKQFKVLGGTRPSDKDRERFISGRAFGVVSIWGQVHKGISDARSKYDMISPAEEKGLHGLVDRVADFSPAQRKTLLDLMDRVRG